MADPNAEMHERSGRVVFMDVFIAVFYDLLKHYPPADIEKLVRDACATAGVIKVYSNGWLARYAQDMVRRLDQARDPSATSTPLRPR